ncbi:hypothetical protein HY251_05715, partial [bacterium]|nr:hypothetical protein [bacterium]
EIFKERGHGRDTVLSFKRIAEGLLAGGLRGAVDIVSAEQAGKAVQKKAHVDERVVVRLAYARTLALMGEYKEHGREPDLRRYFWRKMTRAVQGLATLASKEFGQRALLSLTTIKDADERWVTHAVNTCILSILLGRKLGLPRAQLAHVGLAALLHRVGEVRGAPAGTSKPGAHAWSGLGAILESRRTDDAALACALVVFEQGQPPSRARAPENEPHPLGQLVAICATFEELTTAVPGRLSLVPADALRMLMEGKPRPLDPTLVRIFGEVIQPPKTGAPRTDTSSSDRLGSSSSDSIRAFLEDDE